MPKARMRHPVHACYLLRIELDLLMKRAAQRMEHRTFDGVAQRLRVDHQAAVVRAYQPLHPDVAGAAVHLDLGYLRGNGLSAECIRETAPGHDVPGSNWFWRGARIPPVSFRRRLYDRNRPGPLEPGIFRRARREELHTKFNGVGFRGEGQFVDERFGREGRLRPVGIAQISRANRRFPGERAGSPRPGTCGDSG